MKKTHPFLITNSNGERVASAEHMEEAMFLLRVLPIAAEIVRSPDGALLATRRVMLTTALRGAA